MSEQIDKLANEFRDEGLKRIKLAITDMDGVLRGKYLTLDKFASLAKSPAGFCDCIFGWDLGDELYDNVSFSCWDKGFPDAPYRLDLNSVRRLPYEEQTPFFLAELVPPGGKDFHPICPRNQLRSILSRLGERGLSAKLAFEYEFFLFDETPHSIRQKGYQNLKSLTPGMFGYSILRNSVFSDLHQEFLDYCESLQTPLEGYHTETGPGVMEGALEVCDALEAADRASLFKTFTKVFFQKQGLMATFMARWTKKYPGQSGHLHISLNDKENGNSSFYDPKGRGQMSPLMESFVAGQVKYMRELCAMIAPTINSYSRLVKGAWAPTASAWGIDNRTTALRVISGSPKSQRVEYRVGAADGNPYLVAACGLASGLAGIEENLKLGDPITGNAYDKQDSLAPEYQLPSWLGDAASAFRNSQMARRYFGDEFVDHFAATREWEVRQFTQEVTDWELKRYFEII